MQGALIPVAIAAMGSTLYGGIRHTLFMVQALIGIAAIIVPVLDAKLDKAIFNSTIIWAAVLAIFAPTLGIIGLVQWFPYAYAQINPLASSLCPDRGWYLDAWRLSAMQGVLIL